MKHKRLKLSAVLLLGLGLTGLQAQESSNATGSNASGSGGSANYSVGQIVYTTNTGTSGSLAQGIQQAYVISVATAIEEANGINLTVSVYPNPTSDYLQLKVENAILKDFSYKLMDMSGKLLETRTIESDQTSIAMKNLRTATYFVQVIQGNRKIKTFKIIKN